MYPVEEVRVREIGDGLEGLLKRPMGGTIRGGRRGMRIMGGQIEEWWPLDYRWIHRKYRSDDLQALSRRLNAEIEGRKRRGETPLRLPSVELERMVGVADRRWEKRRGRTMGNQMLLKGKLVDKVEEGFDYGDLRKPIAAALFKAAEGLEPHMKDVDLTSETEFTVPITFGKKFWDLKGVKAEEKRQEILDAIRDELKKGTLRISHLKSFGEKE